MRLRALCAALLAGAVAVAEEPPLPPGLGAEPATAEPALPAGLDGAPASEEPALPSGLGGAPGLPPGPGSQPGPAAIERAESGLRSRAWLPPGTSGFLEVRGGVRTRDDPDQKDASIGEARLQLQTDRALGPALGRLTADFLYDPVLDEQQVDLEEGRGWLDLREANLLFRPGERVDLKIGRQILTWGTGDLVFINDLFPKDWNSFLIGRDDEYLKAPSDALRLSVFTDLLNVEFVYSPRFDSDRFIDGRRISYYNPLLGEVVGRSHPLPVEERDAWIDDDEIALRAYRSLGSWEYAIYAYSGYWKSPGGFEPRSGAATFPALEVAGASARGPLLGGIASVEGGWYHSRDDGNGRDPFVNNSEWRLLGAFERELLPELTLAVQYYLEHMVDRDAYSSTLPPGTHARDENRQVITVRLTRLLMNQNLTLSLFNFYSPTDEDGYARPRIDYKWSDSVRLELGGNLFYGRRNYSFFGQFQDASNLYVSVRYGF